MPDPTAHDTETLVEVERLLGQWQRGEVPVDAVLSLIAARIVQARAGEGALRERIEAMLVEAEQSARHPWSRGPDGQPSVMSIGADSIRAALTDTAGDPT